MIKTTIYKYSVTLTDVFELDVPKGAELLCVQMQHGEPRMWARVNPDNELEKRTIRVVGTGHKMERPKDKEFIYIDTFQMYNGDLVFHVFEVW